MKSIIIKMFTLQILLLSPLFWRPARMLFILIILAGGVAGGEAFAQKTPEKNMEVTTQDAFYPKGDQALYMYVMYNTKYSEESKQKTIEGNVSLSFDVMPDSSLKNIKIISDPGYGVGEGVKVVVETLKFAPALQMGMPVRMNVMMDFPVKAH